MTSSLKIRDVSDTFQYIKGTKRSDRVTPSIVKYMETNLDLMKPLHSEQILPVLNIIYFVQIQTKVLASV